MKITNEIKTRKIELLVIESIEEHLQSYQLKISVDTENIKTTFDDCVWVAWFDIDKFIESIDQLDKTRKGQARLQSMSPGEFELVLKPIDNLGHLAVSLHFVKEDRIDKDYSFDVKVEFQIDASSLPRIKLDMQELFK